MVGNALMDKVIGSMSSDIATSAVSKENGSPHPREIHP